MFAVLETIVGDPTLDMVRYVGVPCESADEARELMVQHTYGVATQWDSVIIELVAERMMRITDHDDTILYNCWIMDLK